MQQYNLKYGYTSKLSPTDPLVYSPPLRYSRQQHQHPLPNINPDSVPKNYPPIKTLGITPEVTYTTDQHENIQELLSEFEKLGKSQNIDYNPPQVTTTHENVEKVIPHPPQDLQPAINALANIANTSTTITTSTSSTTTTPSNLSDHTPLLP